MFDSLIVIALAALLVFLLLREFWAWYFKTNETLKVLRQIRDELRKANGEPVDQELKGSKGSSDGQA